MADIVNLKRTRKQKARVEKQMQAAENRAKFGTGKTAKKLSEARRQHDTKQLDQHKREPQ